MRSALGSCEVRGGDVPVFVTGTCARHEYVVSATPNYARQRETETWKLLQRCWRMSPVASKHGSCQLESRVQAHSAVSRLNIGRR